MERSNTSNPIFLAPNRRNMSAQAFLVEGGCRLSGEITPQGAKNEALQVLCATLMTDEPVTIHNIPDILDVRKLIALLDGLGVEVERLGTNSYRFTASNLNLDYLGSDDYEADARKIRGSVMLIAPLLLRCGRAYLPKPGGDKIGRRRLDTHFHGFETLGAVFRFDPAEDKYYLDATQLQGTYVHMEEISVTGTANVVMAAVCANGTTTIYNAACEPYVQQLCRMLNSMGANIKGNRFKPPDDRRCGQTAWYRTHRFARYDRDRFVYRHGGDDPVQPQNTQLSYRYARDHSPNIQKTRH